MCSDGDCKVRASDVIALSDRYCKDDYEKEWLLQCMKSCSDGAMSGRRLAENYNIAQSKKKTKTKSSGGKKARAVKSRRK
jgi:hypothetical protein